MKRGRKPLNKTEEEKREARKKYQMAYYLRKVAARVKTGAGRYPYEKKLMLRLEKLESEVETLKWALHAKNSRLDFRIC